MKKKSITHYESPKFMKTLTAMLTTAGILSLSAALVGCATEETPDYAGDLSVVDEQTYDKPDISFESIMPEPPETIEETTLLFDGDIDVIPEN